MSYDGDIEPGERKDEEEEEGGSRTAGHGSVQGKVWHWLALPVCLFVCLSVCSTAPQKQIKRRGCPREYTNRFSSPLSCCTTRTHRPCFFLSLCFVCLFVSSFLSSLHTLLLHCLIPTSYILHPTSSLAHSSPMHKLFQGARHHPPASVNKPLPEPLVDPDEGKTPIGRTPSSSSSFLVTSWRMLFLSSLSLP